MKILLPALLLSVVVLAAPEGGELKEKIQAMLDEAALLDQAGRHDEAARVREEAKELKQKLGAMQDGKESADDPRMQALANLEKAIGALEKAGYEGMARELGGMADRLRGEIKGARGQEQAGKSPGADFWRRNLDTLRIAMKGLAEAKRPDAAEMMERAVRARELMVEGKPDMAERAMKDSPDDAQLAELLLTAAGCWRQFKQPEKAAQCEELGRFFQHRMEEQKRTRIVREDVDRKAGFQREGPGPDDRMARLEERLDRMERMLHETLERLAARDRDLEAQREAQREADRKDREPSGR